MFYFVCQLRGCFGVSVSSLNVMFGVSHVLIASFVHSSFSALTFSVFRYDAAFALGLVKRPADGVIHVVVEGAPILQGLQGEPVRVAASSTTHPRTVTGRWSSRSATAGRKSLALGPRTRFGSRLAAMGQVSIGRPACRALHDRWEGVD